MLDYSVRELLSYLYFGGGYGYWWCEATKRSTCWPASSPDRLPDCVDVYFGVHPLIRTKNEHERANSEDVAVINSVYVDLDIDSFGGGRGGIRTYLKQLKLQPNVLIESGRGFCCFWLLERPLMLEGPQERERAKRLQEAWVKCVGGNQEAGDLAYLIRVPGTRSSNSSYGAYNRPIDFVQGPDYDAPYSLALLEAQVGLPLHHVKTRSEPKTIPPSTILNAEAVFDLACAPDLDGDVRDQHAATRASIRRRPTPSCVSSLDELQLVPRSGNSLARQATPKTSLASQAVTRAWSEPFRAKALSRADLTIRKELPTDAEFDDQVNSLPAAEDSHGKQASLPSEPATWADMEARLDPVVFDWKGWLAPGFLTMLVGASGDGKSNVMLRCAGTYMNGWPWPDGTAYGGETGKVLWCEAEAAQAMNLERAKAWGLPIDCILSPLTNPLEDVDLFNLQHRAAIAAIAQRADVRCVVVDSLSAACGGREKADEQMPVVKWLAQLARNTNKPVIVLHHLRKRGMQDSEVGVALDRVRGSTVIVQLARLVWAIDTPDAKEPGHKRLSVIKSNLSKFPDPVGLRINDQGLRFDAAPQAPRTATQTERAVDLLKSLLAHGPVPSAELEEKAEEAGISWDTVKTAKDKLGVVARRDGKEQPDGKKGRWLCSLPAQGQEPST